MLNIPLYRGNDGSSLVKLRREHLLYMDLKEPELTYERDMPTLREYLWQESDPNASWTGMMRGKPVMSFGIRPAWRGVGEAWLLPSKYISEHTISIVRYGRKFFADLLNDGPYVRIHMSVRADNDIALKFAKTMGFEIEGIMRYFGPDGVDCYMMARISPNAGKNPTA